MREGVRLEVSPTEKVTNYNNKKTKHIKNRITNSKTCQFVYLGFNLSFGTSSKTCTCACYSYTQKGRGKRVASREYKEEK